MRTDSAKGVGSDWQIVVTVEETTPGDTLDLLLRREQTHALYRLAANPAPGEPSSDRK